jgi:hypothetical protein
LDIRIDGDSEEEMRMGDESQRDTNAKPAADEFEQEKWEKEADFREREIKLRERELGIKEAETRPSLFKNTLFLSVAAAVVGLVAHTAGDFGTKWMQSDDENRRQQESLIQKAMEHEDPMRVIAKLKLLNEAGLIPDYSKSVRKLTDDDRGAQYFAFNPPDSGRQYQAALIEKAIENDDLGRVLKKLQLLDDADLIPDYSKSSKIRDILKSLRDPPPVIPVGVPAASGSGAPPPMPLPVPAPITPMAALPNLPLPAAVPLPPPTPLPTATPAPSPVATATPSPAAPPDTCAGAIVNPGSPGGWLFLGRMNKDKSEWVPSDSGTRSVKFEAELPERDKDLVQKLQNQCLRTLAAKYLRDDGAPGQKVHAQVKRTLPTRSRVRIVEIDADGIDEPTNNKYPVVWARVEVVRD